MMMPSREAPPLEVIKPQFALEFLVDLLGAVALLDEADDLLLRHLAGQRGEEVPGGLFLAHRPLDQEPLGSGVDPRLARHLDPKQGEPRRERLARPLPPRAPAKRLRSEIERDL